MTEIRAGGWGGKRLPDKPEKEDKPVWETDEFREQVRRIKERESQQPVSAAPPKEKKEPTFNIPLPGRGGVPLWVAQQNIKNQKEKIRTEVKQEIYDFLKANPEMTVGPNLRDYIDYKTEVRWFAKTNPSSRGDTATKRHASRADNISRREEIKQREQEIEQIERDVRNEFRTRPMGMTPEKAEEFIQNKIQERVDRLIDQKPRYVFLSDGTPFALDDVDERAKLERSLIGESPLKRKWMLYKYDFANNIAKSIEFISTPEIRLKEALTDTGEKGNVVGAAAQLGLNLVLLGYEYLKYGDYPMFAEQKRADAFRQAAEALKYIDPQKASNLIAQAEDVERGVQAKKILNARLDVAKKAVQVSWENLMREREEKKDIPYMGSGRIEERLEYFRQLEQEAEQLKQEAEELRGNAYNSFNAGNYDQAIRQIREAQQKDRDSALADPYGAYTWIRQPEREEAFLQDAAILELQKGEKLSDSEIRRLKEYHVNAGTEILGSFIYDPLNAIPAAFLDDALRVVKLGAKPIGKAFVKGFQAAEKIPVAGVPFRIMGGTVRWMRRQSVQSAASKMAEKAMDSFDKIYRAYNNSTETVAALKEIAPVIKAAKGAANEDAARAIFNNSRNTIPGLENLAFGDFKRLMDAADNLDPDEWAGIYEKSLSAAEDRIIDLAKKNGVEPDVTDIAKTRQANVDMATKFHGAYVNRFRIHGKSRFTDDTIAGWVTKTMRELSGEQINEALKLSGFDEALQMYSKTLGKNSKEIFKGLGQVTEGILTVAANISDFWKGLVLTTSRYLVGNLIDSAMRASTVYGGNILDDMATLFASTQRHFADELGFVPMALTQSLARTDLALSEDVTSRLLYEAWRPNKGLFSYIGYEYKRLLKTDQTLAKNQMFHSLLNKLPDGKFKNALGWLGDGMNFKASLPALLGGIKGGVADFNTAIEFTFRLRMFHRRYFQLLEKLEPQFLEKGLKGLSPQTRELAIQLWKASEGNPRRMVAYAEALAGKSVKGTPAEWAFIVPPGIDDIMKNIPVEDRQLFISDVRSQLEVFIRNSIRQGDELTPQKFNEFFDKYIDDFRDNMQARMSAANSWRDVDTTIRKDGKVTPPPDITELKGSAPVGNNNARAKAIEKSTQKINRGKRGRSKDIAENFKTAVSDFADMESVPGAGVEVIMRDNRPVIQIGQETLGGKPDDLYDALHEATIQLFKTKDESYIRNSGFKNLNDYETTFRQFIEEPAAVLDTSERKFLTIANQLEQNPQLKELLERTRFPKGKEKDIARINYESTLNFYRDIGEYSTPYGFTTPPEKFFEEAGQEVLENPGYYVAAAQESAVATADLHRAASNLPRPMMDKILDFSDRLQVYRNQLKEVYRFVYPGPKLRSAAQGRSAAWEKFFQLSAKQYGDETVLKRQLLDLLEKDPAAAEKFIDDATQDFGNWFLEKHGVTLEWDADNQIIRRMTINTGDRNKSFTNPRDLEFVQRRLFTTDINRKIAQHPPTRLRKDNLAKIKNQLINELKATFNLPSRRHAENWAKVINNHAEMWAKETGRPVEEYYQRLGFQRIEDMGQGLVTRERTRLLKGAGVEKTEDGIILYGLSQSNFESMVQATSHLFWDDLRQMAEFSDQAAADLDNLKKFLEKVTGKKIKANQLNEAHSKTLSTLFTDYIFNGNGPEISMKGGMESFKRWMNATYKGIQGTPLEGEISDDVLRVMDRMFIEEQISVTPRTHKRKIKVIARELGIEFEDEDELLRLINESVDPGSTLPDPVSMTPEQIAQRAELEQRVTALETELSEMTEGLNLGYDEFGNAPRYPDVDAKIEELEAAQKALSEFDDRVARMQAAGMSSNESVDPGSTTPDVPSLSPELQAQRAALEEAWRAADEEYRMIADELADIAGDNTGMVMNAGNNPRLLDAEQKMEEAQRALREFDDQVARMQAAGMSSVEPEVWYHGTRGDFDPKDIRSGVADLGVFITKDENLAKQYTTVDLHGEEGAGRILAFNVFPTQTLETRFGQADPAAIGAVIDNMISKLDPEEIWTDRIVRKLEQAKEGLARAQNPQQWKTAEAKIMDAAMEISQKTGGEFTSVKPYRDALIEMGYDSIRKIDDGADTMVVLDTNILKEAQQVASPAPSVIKPKPAFDSLEDVPIEVVQDALAKGKESKIAQELSEAWDVWKTQRALVGFPEEALESAETFKAYLRRRMGEEWSETANYYNRLLWEVEQFEDALLNHHVRDEFAEVLFPRVPDAQISDGMKTFIRNQESMVSNYEASLQALQEWRTYMANYASNGHPAFVLPKEQAQELLDWAKRASNDKAELIDTVINGNGDDIEGALNDVNRVMIDYQYTNNLDNIMKNFMPFWKFPSRSMPFWAETLITHPQLVAAYEKLQRASRSQRYQAGAVTSKGKPLPSLDGYIKIPGTDLWFNPLAPFSFRYLLDISKSIDDLIYASNTAEEMEPKAWMVKEMMQTGQVYGFSLAPWMTWLMKSAMDIPDEVIPRFPITPHIPLIPRWAVANLIAKSAKITNPFGKDFDLSPYTSRAANFLYPEAPWHDFLVERHLLEQTAMQIQMDPNMTDRQKFEAVSKVKEAIKVKGDNPVWQKAYKEVTGQEWVRSTVSFFTGFYPKEFGATQALLLSMRDEHNQWKSALNNEFQANIFDIPTEPGEAWSAYLDRMETPEGWVRRLYADIGWVQDDNGMLVRNPKDRAKYLAEKIIQDEQMDIFYEEMGKLYDWYNDAKRGLPIGASWEEKKSLYDEFARRRAQLDHLRVYEKHYGTNKPRELIEKDLTMDWYFAVNNTRPRWEVEQGETYPEFQLRVKEWQDDLPNIAPILMKGFLTPQGSVQKTLAALHDDQKIDMSFFDNLVRMTTAQGMEEWEKQNDDLFDALDKAYRALYWDEYWDSVIGKTGYEVDLAEEDFFNKHPQPPSADEMFEWINLYYGEGRFTLEQVKEWVEESDVLSVDEKRLAEADDPDRYQKTQRIWELLSWLGPGGRNNTVFRETFSNEGGDPQWLDTWYDEGGQPYLAHPERLDQLYETLEATARTLQLKPPDRPELIRFIQAQEENEVFKELVTKELGPKFYDWVDENGVEQNGLLSYYNGLPSSSQYKFRKERPDDYAVILQYRAMKETFAAENPTWADYYGPGLETTLRPPVDPVTGSTLMPPDAREPIPEPVIRTTPATPGGGKPGGGGRRRGDDGVSNVKPAAPQPEQRQYTNPYIPQFTIRDRTGTQYISPGLYRLAGNKLAWEITEFITRGRRISVAGQNFLRSLASRYPDYREEITNILSRQ